MSRFDYIKYDAISETKQALFKKIFEEVSQCVLQSLPKGRDQALAFTKLEEAYMWVGKALRDEQIERNGSAELQEERKDG